MDESEANINVITTVPKLNNNDNTEDTKNRKCYRCGNRFMAGHLQNCPATKKTCNHCGLVGHFRKVCRKQNEKIKFVNKEENDTQEFVNIVNVENNNDFEYESVFSTYAK